MNLSWARRWKWTPAAQAQAPRPRPRRVPGWPEGIATGRAWQALSRPSTHRNRRYRRSSERHAGGVPNSSRCHPWLLIATGLRTENPRLAQSGGIFARQGPWPLRRRPKSKSPLHLLYDILPSSHLAVYAWLALAVVQPPTQAASTTPRHCCSAPPAAGPDPTPQPFPGRWQPSSPRPSREIGACTVRADIRDLPYPRSSFVRQGG